MRVIGMMMVCDRCGYKDCAPAIFNCYASEIVEYDQSVVDKWGVNLADDLCPTCYQKLLKGEIAC